MESTGERVGAGPKGPLFEAKQLADAIADCVACAQSCTACADACMGEEDVEPLRRCIRLNLDCADVAEITGRMLSRQMEPEPELLAQQLELLVAMTRACGDECERHAQTHEHCRVCMEACRRCEEACQGLLDVLGEGIGQASVPVGHA